MGLRGRRAASPRGYPGSARAITCSSAPRLSGPGRCSRPGTPACRAAWGRRPAPGQLAPPSGRERLRRRRCVLRPCGLCIAHSGHVRFTPLVVRRLPPVRLAPNHLKAWQQRPVQVGHQPPAQVRVQPLLELPPTPQAGAAKDVPPVEHPAVDPPPARQDGGAVAVGARGRVLLAPRTLQHPHGTRPGSPPSHRKRDQLRGAAVPSSGSSRHRRCRFRRYRSTGKSGGSRPP